MMSSCTSLFEIYNNRFSQRIPTEIGQVSRMRMGLQAAQNSFSGEIPTEFGEMVLMTSFFQLFSNVLSGTLPTELGRFPGRFREGMGERGLTRTRQRPPYGRATFLRMTLLHFPDSRLRA